MSEPTIDEMLVELDIAKDLLHQHGMEFDSFYAIRAILEQVRASEYLTETITEWLVVKRQLELEAIRAFVERVMGKVSAQYGRVKDPQFGEILMSAIRDEVIVMETEIEAKS